MHAMQETSPRTSFVPVAAVVILLAFAGGLLLAIKRAAPVIPEIPNLLWPPAVQLTDFELLDHRNRSFTRTSLMGKWTLMFFGFTQCPDVCPSTLTALKGVDERLAADPVYATQGQVVFVSVDPERDQQSELGRYVTFFNPDFIGVTGSPSALRELTRQLHILVEKIPSPAALGYSLDHTASIFLLDPSARLVGLYSLPHKADTIAASVRQIREFIEEAS